MHNLLEQDLGFAARDESTELKFPASGNESIQLLGLRLEGSGAGFPKPQALNPKPETLNPKA